MRYTGLIGTLSNLLKITCRRKKCNNSIIPAVLLFLPLCSIIVTAGCINTEGTLELKGVVTDENTKAKIPGRKIIIQGFVNRNNKLTPVEAGQFSVDSTGNFSYSLNKIKDAYFYNFCVVGDSDYAYTVKKLGIAELVKHSGYLSISLRKLVNLTIKIQKTSSIPFRDTLYLSWVSDGIDYRNLYPFRVENFALTDNSFVSLPGIGLRWIGGNINSTVSARVFADKMTKIHWELVRNKTRSEFTDTITCKRSLSHTIYFTY